MDDPAHNLDTPPTGTLPANPPPSWQLAALTSPWTYVLSSAMILVLDFVTGPFIMFPIFFVLPVAVAAWYHNPRTAFALSLVLPVGRLIIATQFEHLFPAPYAIVNAVIRVGVLGFIAYLVGRTARQTKELEHEVKLLEGILHICMFCKRIKDEDAKWQQIESYIAKRSEADFSHGLCQECAQKHYGHILNKKRGG